MTDETTTELGVTGGVRDTLAAIIGDGQAARECADDVLADWLSSPEVVRVATEALTEHTGVRDWDDPQQIECCGIWRSPADHAAHQWSVLVAALRGER